MVPGSTARWLPFAILPALVLAACGAVPPSPAAGHGVPAARTRTESRPRPARPGSIGHAVAEARTGPSLAQVEASLRHARDPRLPAIVATLNGVPIRAQVVAQAEVLLGTQPDLPPAGHAREEAALRLVIRNTLLNDAAVRQGDAPSAAKARRQLVAMGETQPSPARIAQEQRALAALRLSRQVEGQGTPAQQTARLDAYVRQLLAKAKIVKAPGF